jgi:DNA-binding response OmpR family regulator
MALLRLTGFDPLPAGSVAEGLQQLDRSPHCLILDLMLPDGNGSSILAHVRRNKLPISVAVTTGAIDWAEMLQESSEPPNAVFSKPLNFKSIIDWLRDCEQSIQ